jgi:hypothetical protein
MRAKKVNEGIKWLTPRSKEEVDAYYASLPALYKIIVDKIEKYSLNAKIIEVNKDFMILRIKDVEAAVNLGTGGFWYFDTPKGFKYPPEHFKPNFDIKKYYEYSNYAAEQFTNSYGNLSKYSALYYIISFFKNIKYCVIADFGDKLSQAYDEFGKVVDLEYLRNKYDL